MVLTPVSVCAMVGWQVAPILGVSNVPEAVDFFVEQLGFSPPARLYGPPHERVYAIVHRDGVNVHLQIRRNADAPGPREAHEGEAYFFVPDVDALHTEYAAKGVQFLRGLQDEDYGVRDFTIETPFGHRLTFGTQSPPPG